MSNPGAAVRLSSLLAILTPACTTSAACLNRVAGEFSVTWSRHYGDYDILGQILY